MLTSYIKIAWRNFCRNRTSSFINVGGLAVGMAVAMLIGLWIFDELSFNKSFPNHDRIAQVLTNQAYNGGVNTDYNTAPPYGPELRRLYGAEFRHVVMSTRPQNIIVASGDKKLLKHGYYCEPAIADMLSLQMIHGTRGGLVSPASIMFSESTAKAVFGNADPIGRQVTLDNKTVVAVTGVYKDIAYNTDFPDMEFIAPWQLVTTEPWFKANSWEQDGFQTYVQLADNVNMATVSKKIAKLKYNNADDLGKKGNPVVFLLPMNDFHLFSDYENGIVTGEAMRYVWLYGIIGAFVLLLACINFMNLATARSEKRAKEVGIRKAVGSLRPQLIRQFLCESLLISTLSFALSLVLAQLLLPFINEVADKHMVMMWNNPLFWVSSVAFIILTGFIAGSYPAFYLSAFNPVKVLKGTFRAGRWAAIPRKAMVVVQFTVSILLAIGVIVVYRQIKLGKDRPVGYERAGLITVNTPTRAIHAHFESLRRDLQASGVAKEASESYNPVTTLGFASNKFDWGVAHDNDFWIGKAYVGGTYGKTIGWQIVDGRDFTGNWKTDSATVILNETVVKYMGLKHPVGAIIKESPFGTVTTYTVVGVVRDILQQSPYRSVKETVYIANNDETSCIMVRVNPGVSMSAALRAIEPVFHKYDPGSPFEYRFIDQEYARKFGGEERISKLAGFFAILAIFISCLGLFGMASFMAEQRTKEIGVRKVLGASVISLWGLLSRGFAGLVVLSLLIATPIAYYFMNDWLQSYQMRTSLSWWIFAAAGLGAMTITLCTVSVQAVRAALMNPTKSLRNE